METTGRNYDEDVFGNKSSTRKLRRVIVYFTLFMISIMVITITIRLAVDGLKDVTMDWSIFAFLISIILILFTAAFAPAAFSQSKEWMAFIQSMKK